MRFVDFAGGGFLVEVPAEGCHAHVHRTPLERNSADFDLRAVLDLDDVEGDLLGRVRDQLDVDLHEKRVGRFRVGRRGEECGVDELDPLFLPIHGADEMLAVRLVELGGEHELIRRGAPPLNCDRRGRCGVARGGSGELQHLLDVTIITDRGRLRQGVEGENDCRVGRGQDCRLDAARGSGRFGNLRLRGRSRRCQNSLELSAAGEGGECE